MEAGSQETDTVCAEPEGDMIDIEKVQSEIDDGLSAVCAWCENYWRVKNINGGSGVVCGIRGCGGPMSGLAYPKYEGPLHKNVHMICHICGKEPTIMVEVGNGMVGVCESGKNAKKRKVCFDVFKNNVAGRAIVVERGSDADSAPSDKNDL